MTKIKKTKCKPCNALCGQRIKAGECNGQCHTGEVVFPAGVSVDEIIRRIAAQKTGAKSATV